MESRLDPYISFKDNAREAMEFYQTVFGGKLTMQTFKDFNASSDPDDDLKIMHAMLEAENGISFMASDTPSRMEYSSGSSISLTLSGDRETELKGYFEKLSVGGRVTVPLAQSMWGDMFGICVDRFGVNWMVNITKPKG
jgi:PhnB protein